MGPISGSRGNAQIFPPLRARVRGKYYFFNWSEFNGCGTDGISYREQKGILKGFWNRWQIGEVIRLAITAATINPH
jgi:hypothetical protein